MANASDGDRLGQIQVVGNQVNVAIHALEHFLQLLVQLLRRFLIVEPVSYTHLTLPTILRV